MSYSSVQDLFSQRRVKLSISVDITTKVTRAEKRNQNSTMIVFVFSS